MRRFLSFFLLVGMALVNAYLGWRLHEQNWALWIAIAFIAARLELQDMTIERHREVVIALEDAVFDDAEDEPSVDPAPDANDPHYARKA